MAFRGLWRGQGAPTFLQRAGRGPRGGVGEGSVCYIYIRTKGLFVMYIGTEGLRGCIRVSEGTDVGSTRQRHKASADLWSTAIPDSLRRKNVCDVARIAFRQ